MLILFIVFFEVIVLSFTSLKEVTARETAQFGHLSTKITLFTRKSGTIRSTGTI